MTDFEIGSAPLTVALLRDILKQQRRIALSPQSKDAVARCREYLNEKTAEPGKLFYGINTGFGALCNVQIPQDQVNQLQENLVVSHACGIGDEVPEEIVRLMLLLKVQSLSYGYSGVDVSTVWRLADFYNNSVLPVVFEQGSLGASGDLAPLAHLCLPLLGKGQVRFEGNVHNTENLFPHFRWKPLLLQSKEGLALLNGTQFMSAYGVHILMRAQRLMDRCDAIAALSCDAFDARIDPFDDALHRIRPHAGQMLVAARMRDWLKGSEIASRQKQQVQDPYSFRCIPQVHGASRDSIGHAENVFETEINSVTDNPNVFVDEDAIMSGGNFHGQPLAIALDLMCIALSELANISERRTYQLISGSRSLPPFLAADPGLNSGLMIPQYTAAALVSQSKQLCTPSSADSIPSSNGQEDHVSMGANGATKCYRVLENAEKVLAIELLTAAQALEFRRPLRSSEPLEKIVADYRSLVSFNTVDRVLHDDIRLSVDFVRTYALPDLY